MASKSALSFHVKAECNVSKARVGLMKLPHYEVKTPVFMPVGTQVRDLPCRISRSLMFRISIRKYYLIIFRGL